MVYWCSLHEINTIMTSILHTITITLWYWIGCILILYLILFSITSIWNTDIEYYPITIIWFIYYFPILDTLCNRNVVLLFSYLDTLHSITKWWTEYQLIYYICHLLHSISCLNTFLSFLIPTLHWFPSISYFYWIFGCLRLHYCGHRNNPLYVRTSIWFYLLLDSVVVLIWWSMRLNHFHKDISVWILQCHWWLLV